MANDSSAGRGGGRDKPRASGSSRGSYSGSKPSKKTGSKQSGSKSSAGKSGSGHFSAKPSRSKTGSKQSQGGSRSGSTSRGREGSSSQRSGYQSDRGSRDQASKARRDLEGAAVDLPRWVIEALSRVTPKERVSAALSELGAASNAMIEGRYKVALRSARRAKELAPRDVTVRETLGLAAYRTGDWQTALAELRTYRRLAGEATHMPVEMDALRALGRSDDVDKTWKELQGIQVAPAVHKEGLVVYASHLIDKGRPDEARRLTNPKNITKNPYPADLRVWYVAARANAMLGEGPTARRLRDAITLADPAFPGLDELDSEIARIPS